MWQISLRILSPIVDVSSRCPASSCLGLVQCPQQQLEKAASEDIVIDEVLPEIQRRR
jgi:hypothetical protein